MDRVHHGFVKANGLRLHYLDYGGDGRPILCLHGVTGHAWVWRDVASTLTSAGRVVALDFRSFGDSQWSPTESYTTADHVSDLEALVASLGTDDVDIAGSSWGGLVGIAFAAANPGRVRRLALVDVSPSSPQAEDDVPPRAESFESHAEALEAERAANPNAPDGMVEVAAAFGTRPGEGGRLYRKQDPYFLQRWPFRADDRWDELRGLAAPVLVVHAENSFIPAEVAQKMATEAKDASLVEIPSSGHVIPLENPAALSEALAGFFTS
ncbi:MAG: alpha/beta fold hydrolase [Actinomycetota bacterium]